MLLNAIKEGLIMVKLKRDKKLILPDEVDQKEKGNACPDWQADQCIFQPLSPAVCNCTDWARRVLFGLNKWPAGAPAAMVYLAIRILHVGTFKAFS